MIETAAIIHLGVTYTLPRPKRHHDIIRYMIEECEVMPPCSGQQGFLTTEGKFVDRIEGRVIAEQNNQLLPSASKGHRLFSEDMW